LGLVILFLEGVGLLRLDYLVGERYILIINAITYLLY